MLLVNQFNIFYSVQKVKHNDQEFMGPMQRTAYSAPWGDVWARGLAWPLQKFSWITALKRQLINLIVSKS